MDDGTRLARIEVQLAELEALYLDAPVGLCFLDSELRFQRINERMAEINGKSVNEHLGRTPAEVIPAIGDQVTPVYLRILRTGEPVVDLEVRGTLPSDPDHEHVWLVNHHPVFSDDGVVRGISTVVVDITEVTRNVDDLESGSARLAEAQRIAGVGSWEWDILEDEVWWSDEMFRLFRKQQHDFVPSLDGFYETIHPLDRPMFRRQLEATLAHNVPYVLEIRILTDDGDERIIHASAALVRSPEGLPARLIGTAYDMTDRHRAEKERTLTPYDFDPDEH